MIQDISKKFDNQYCNRKADANDLVICFKDNKILLCLKDDVISYPTVAEIENVGQYLFSIDDTKYFLGNSDEFADYKYYPIITMRSADTRENAFAGVTAYHISNWYNDNKYCGRCGAVMEHSDKERAMVCKCGNTVYPKISPAVIVGVVSGDKICLTKYNRPNAHWALVAGFNEAGETIEETVHREVMEELGLKVKNLVYYKSQPWGLTSTLLYGFFCQVDGDEKIKLDNVELKDGKWFTADEIDFENDNFSLTREMIENFKQGRVY